MSQLFVRARASVIATSLVALCSVGCSEVMSPMEGPLADLTIGPAGTLEPAFSSMVSSYTATVASDATNVAITVTPESKDTTVTINGISARPGKEQTVPLRSPGTPTPIEIVTTAPSGRGSYYSVLVSRKEAKPAGDGTLSALAAAPGELQPAFSPQTNVYTVNVDHLVESVILTATKSHPQSTLSGALSLAPGVASGDVNIKLGDPGSETPASLAVAANGQITIYTVILKRALAPGTQPPPGGGGGTTPPPALSTVSTLKSVTFNQPGGSALNATTYRFTGQRGQTVAITVTKSDPKSVMTFSSSLANYTTFSKQTVPAGELTGTVSVTGIGGFVVTITIHVTAEDKIHSTTYTINVDTPAAPTR